MAGSDPVEIAVLGTAYTFMSESGARNILERHCIDCWEYDPSDTEPSGALEIRLGSIIYAFLSAEAIAERLEDYCAASRKI